MRAERAETYGAGLGRAISGSLLAVFNRGSSGTLVTLLITDSAVPLKTRDHVIGADDVAHERAAESQ